MSGRTCMEPALEGQAAFLDIEWEIVDVERAGGDHLDWFVVAHQSVVGHVDVRYVRGLPHVNAVLTEDAPHPPKKKNVNVLADMCKKDDKHFHQPYNSLMRISGTQTLAVGREICLTSSKSSGFQTRNSSVHDLKGSSTGEG